MIDYWITPLSISLFGFAFWQLNHLLHRQMGAAYGQITGSAVGGERSFDRWMGIATGLCLLPLFFVFYLYESPVLRIIAAAGWPVIVMIGLGYVRGLQSGSSILFQAAHGASVSLLAWLVALRPDAASCSNIAASLQTELAVLTYCAGMTQFWINTWLTASLAFAAMFAATLIAMYAVDLKDFGWEAHPKQRHVLAIVYVFSTVWILIEALVRFGVPLLNDAVLLSEGIRLLGPPALRGCPTHAHGP